MLWCLLTCLSLLVRHVDALVPRDDTPQPQSSKPKTPIIAGSVCGAVMGLAWIIGFSIYFWKRYKRKRLNQQIREGKVDPSVKKHKPEPSHETVVIPPDPAVLLGQRSPGERVYENGGRTPPNPPSSPSSGVLGTRRGEETPEVAVLRTV